MTSLADPAPGVSSKAPLLDHRLAPPLILLVHLFDPSRNLLLVLVFVPSPFPKRFFGFTEPLGVLIVRPVVAIVAVVEIKPFTLRVVLYVLLLYAATITPAVVDVRAVVVPMPPRVVVFLIDVAATPGIFVTGGSALHRRTAVPTFAMSSILRSQS